MKNYNLNIRHFVLMVFFLSGCFTKDITNRRSDRSRQNVIQYCPPCDMRQCPIVAADICNGVVMKDSCNCCPVCKSIDEPHFAEEDFTSSLENDTQPAACTGIECQRHEICLLNIQGLPVCRCPTIFYCKNKPRQKVCSSDGETFTSICILKMTSCDESRKITVAKKGACNDDLNTDSKTDRARLRQDRLRERQKERQDKLEHKRLEKEIKQELRRQKKQQGKSETSSEAHNRKRDARGNRKGQGRTIAPDASTTPYATRDARRRDRKRQKRIDRNGREVPSSGIDTV